MEDEKDAPVQWNIGRFQPLATKITVTNRTSVPGHGEADVAAVNYKLHRPQISIAVF
jgi:hypothetical protein